MKDFRTRPRLKLVRPALVNTKKKHGFFDIAVTSLIFNIFAPDFFKPILLALESSKISKNQPVIEDGPSYHPSEGVVSTKKWVKKGPKPGFHHFR